MGDTPGKTTADFGANNKVLSWLVGLNFQIEHHLFPRISHVHYPEISKIVAKTCQNLACIIIISQRSGALLFLTLNL